MIIVVFILISLTALYLYGTSSFDYWKKKGVVHDRPWPLVGNTVRRFLLTKTVAQYCEELYFKFKNEKVVGFYKSIHPELFILDPEFVRRVLIQDALTHFHSRGMLPNKKHVQPLNKNLFFLEGDDWYLLRKRLTPMFTSAKLKVMFPLIVERAEKLKTTILSCVGETDAHDAKELVARYTTDVIGACCFGVEADSLDDEHSEFRKLGKLILTFKSRDRVKSILKSLFPLPLKHIKTRTDLEEEMKEFVAALLKKRNYQPVGRGDFVDLLLECREQGTIYGESLERVVNGVSKKASMEFDDDIILGQMLIFFVGGFEPSSSGCSFTLYQLALNQEVQAKARKEVDEVLFRYNGQLCYDAIKEMIYLDWCLKESFRMFPPLPILTRECANTYSFPEINLTIDPGVKVLIPIIGFHKDPKYFKDPEAFRPERFHPDEFGPVQRQLYLPYGDGPRNCIAARMGLMQSVAGLAAILSAFTVELAPDSGRHPEIEIKSFLLQIFKGGLPLQFKKRKFAN